MSNSDLIAAFLAKNEVTKCTSGTTTSPKTTSSSRDVMKVVQHSTLNPILSSKELTALKVKNFNKVVKEINTLCHNFNKLNIDANVVFTFKFSQLADLQAYELGNISDMLVFNTLHYGYDSRKLLSTIKSKIKSCIEYNNMIDAKQL